MTVLSALLKRSSLTFAVATVAASISATSIAFAGYEAPNNPAHAAPTNYYNAATATDSANLRLQLRNIISSGFVARSYGDTRNSMQVTDRDPNNPNNIILMYNRASVSKIWDSGATYNREHVWPDSKLGINTSNGTVGSASDLFEIRPANPSINSSRSNLAFGGVNSTGSYGHASPYYFPGDADKGDAARTIFYMATRYHQPGQPLSSSNLQIVNGSGGTYQMGDLQSLLKFHYTDGVDNFERQRNHLIYSQADNPSYYQGNRNPYIDHPEYVWAVFGGGNNNSQLSVNSPNASGASARNVVLPKVIVGAGLSNSTVTINKAGANPTTYDLTTSGNAVTSAAGVGQAFDYNAQSRNITVGLNSSTATPGLKSGVITLNNTDLTTGGAGLGSADGNDTINISASVLAHSEASFSSVLDQNSLLVDFGAVQQGTLADESFSIFNLESFADYTASLNLNSISSSGNTTSFLTDLGTFTNLAAGSALTFTSTFNTSTLGIFSATYLLNVFDENLPGATAGSQLSLVFRGEVIAVPEPIGLSLLGIGGVIFLRRRRAM